MARILPIFQVDAFADAPFKGNPAAVVPLTSWLDESLMQRIAMENNLSETAFFVPVPGGYEIRWFTPVSEIDLCGHATLASAFVIFDKLGANAPRIRFESKSGPLYVAKEGDRFVLDFPSRPPRRLEEYPETLVPALGKPILGVYRHRDLLVELEDEFAVRDLEPDMGALKELREMVIVTAPGHGKGPDFVSRFFAPGMGVDEDPVTGSAHAQLIPFWAARLRKQSLFARQLSRRGGDLWCRLEGDRVYIGGRCLLFLEGTIFIPE